MIINISSIENLNNITLDLLNQELTNTSEFKEEVIKKITIRTQEKKK